MQPSLATAPEIPGADGLPVAWIWGDEKKDLWVAVGSSECWRGSGEPPGSRAVRALSAGPHPARSLRYFSTVFLDVTSNIFGGAHSVCVFQPDAMHTAASGSGFAQSHMDTKAPITRAGSS